MNKQLGVVFTVVFIDLLGFGIVLPLLPTYAVTFGVSPAAIGLLVTSFSLLQLIAVPVWGGVSDRIGRRPVLIVGLVGSTASYLLFAFARTYWVLLVSRIVAGAMGATVGVAQAYIADVTTPERRAHAMGMLGAAFAMGFILGPAIGGLLSTHSYASAGLVAGALCAANAVAALAWLPETPQHRAARSGERVRLGPLAAPFAASLLVTAAFAVLHVTLPLFGQDVLHDTTRRMGMLFAYMGVISAIVQGGVVGRLAPSLGERRLAVAGALLLAVGLAATPRSSGGLALLVSLGVLTAGSALATPSIYAVVSRRAAPGQQGAALGLTQTASTLGRIVGPTLAGFLIGTSGTAAPFWAGAALALLGLVGALFRARPPAAEPSRACGARRPSAGLMADATPADGGDERQGPPGIGVERVVDEQRPPADHAPRHESPVARIVRVVAVVPHHEVLPRGHDQRPPVVPRRAVGRVIHSRQQVVHLPIPHLRRARVGERIHVLDVGLLLGHAVPPQHGALHLERVARHAHETLDHLHAGLGPGIEHDDVAPPRVAERRQVRVDQGHLGAVQSLVDEQEVPDQEGTLHAARGDPERFDQQGPQDEPDDERDRQRLDPLPSRLLEGLPRLHGLHRAHRLFCPLIPGNS